MTVYQPRIHAQITLPTCGLPAARKAQESTDQVFTLDVHPLRARLVSNGPHEADELELTLSYDEAGLDPRYMRAAEVRFWCWDGASQANPSWDVARFEGMARDIERDLSESTAKVVRMLVHDYTGLFLEHEPYPASALPPLAMGLRDAWNLICDHCGYFDMGTRKVVSVVGRDPHGKPGKFTSSGTGAKSDPLVFLGGVDPDRPIGSALPARLAKAPLPAPPMASAWTVWTMCCDLLGLITFIRGDRCIVTPYEDFYTAGDPPIFTWGENILTLNEKRSLGQLSAKNVCVRSYDPTRGATLESFYPPLDSPAAGPKKRLAAGKTAIAPSEYELIDYPWPVATQAALDAKAQQIWQERVRQELAGTLTTRAMRVRTMSGDTFDVLQLQAGDEMIVQISRDALDLVQAMPTISARIAALVQRGYSQQTAKYVADNLDSVGEIVSEFLVSSVETDIDVAKGSYDTSVRFVNRIVLDGSGAATVQAPNTPKITGKPLPPLAGQKWI